MQIAQAMQIARIVPLTVAIVGLATLIGSNTASAQSQRQTAPGPISGTSTDGTIIQDQAPGLPPVDASQNVRGTNNREVFQVLGLSGVIAAPVTPAYNADATYHTFAGQPGNGANAVLAQSMDGSP